MDIHVNVPSTLKYSSSCPLIKELQVTTYDLESSLFYSMTDGAQQALRRTMEIYSKTTRFALACNASDKIIGKLFNEILKGPLALWKMSASTGTCTWISVISTVFTCRAFYHMKLREINSMYLHLEPIQSRCAVLRYSKLTDTQVLKRLLEVCEAESVSYTDDGLEAIVFTAQGDMRQVEKSHSPLYHSPEKS